MLNPLMIVQGMLIQAEYRERAEKQFEEAIANLPEPTKQAMRQRRLDEAAAAQKEAVIERRHRELCNAIRDSRPHGFGIFF